MNRILFAFLVSVGSLFEAAANADDEHFVCRIVSSAGAKEKYELTGFKAKGMPGIYTALHGVVGADSIVGYFHDPETRQVRLKLQDVDIDRDVAYLVEAEPNGEIRPGGIALRGWPSAEQLEALLGGNSTTVIGHALGIDMKPSHTRLTLRSKRPIARLTELLNPSARTELSQRGSPSTGVMMLSLEGHFLPGHSGAPIIDQEGAVIGIGNGGLRDGQVGHGWAVPFYDIKLESAQDPVIAARLQKIPRLGTSRSLFLVVDNEVRQKKELLSQITSTVETEDGRPVQAFRVPALPNSPETTRTKKTGDEASTMSALETFLSGRVFLYSGTPVTIVSEPEQLAKYLPGESLPIGLDVNFVRVRVISNEDKDEQPPELFVPLTSIRQRGDQPDVSIVNSGIMIAGDVTGMVAGRDIIIINPTREPVKKFVLENESGVNLILKESIEDAFEAMLDPNQQLGQVIKGTEIRVLEGTKRTPVGLEFRLIEVLNGELKGKRGWVVMNAIRQVESP